MSQRLRRYARGETPCTTHFPTVTLSSWSLGGEVYGGLEAWVPAHWVHGLTLWPMRARRRPGPFVGRLNGIPLHFWNSAPPLGERDAFFWFVRLVQAIAAAPAGSGPNTPQNCSPDRAYGEEIIVLIVRDELRIQEVFVRYSGCDGHGLDDGHTRRWLTADVLRPVLAGPHRPLYGLQSAVVDLVWSDRMTMW
jgi:hypothetical protein